MKKYLVGFLSVVLVVAAGCGDEETPLTPGDINDAEFQEFAAQFDGMDQAVGLMAEMAFDTIDNIFAQNPQAGGVTNLSSEFALELIWDESTDSWVGTLSYQEEGLTFSATNSVQLLQGTTPVQYPDEELLTEIKTNIDLTATGENIEFSASQNLSIKPGANDVVNMTGSGEFDTDLSVQIVTETGSTDCSFTSHFTTTISNVSIATGEIGSDCPVGGSVRFSGLVSSSCTGEVTSSGSRSWSVTRSWDDTGDSTTEFISGGNIWTLESSCL